MDSQKTDSILIIGSGGREHALAWKLSQSPHIKHIYVSPGNAGTDSNKNISNYCLNVKNHEEISSWCLSNNIALVVVGPEDPLANGLADHLTKSGIKCFGPCQAAAQIEASKEFAKKFMDEFSIPTARWQSFTNADEAKHHIMNSSYEALVVKASGLAAGKGVIVAANKNEAIKAVDTLKEDTGLSSASNTIVIEELLSGEEVSILCFSDGTNISVMLPAQDHKRLLDDDKGPNTGGMGAFCSSNLYSLLDFHMDEVKENILKKAINGMKTKGIPYIGVLYAGLMLTKEGPKVLEFNCRFGDPETQVILPLLKTDLYEIMLACVGGILNKIDVKWSTDRETVGVVLVSGGYPSSYPKGKIITGLDNSKTEYLVFHAGTSKNADKIITSGGRVLAVVAVGTNLSGAINLAKKGCEVINFDGKFYRSDIAHKAVKRNHFGGITYKSAGVDIDSADDLVKKIKTLTKETIRPEVCGGIGGFGGIFELTNYNDPYLICKVSNIGDKLKIAQECFKFKEAGYDLVAIATNELLSHGAEPLFFLDTFTCGKLNTDVAAQVIVGIAKGCKDSNCTLIGGETAEMPGMYADGDFDLTAFARGAVEKPLLLPKREDICDGDIAIGLLSSCLNLKTISVAISLASKLGLTYEDTAPFCENLTLSDVLLSSCTIYAKTLLPLLRKDFVKGISYLMKDGLYQSLNKVLPENFSLILDATKWTIPPVYNWIASNTYLSEGEMMDDFNFGIDLLLIVDKNMSDEVLSQLENSHAKNFAAIGVIRKSSNGESRVKMMNYDHHKYPKRNRKRLAVITSNEGKSFQSLLNYVKNPITLSEYEISLVLSDSNCQNLQRAKESNILNKVLSEKDFDSSLYLNEVLNDQKIDLICLDGFHKKFSNDFLHIWKEKILSTHSSLLPSFFSLDPCKEALSSQVTVTGCSVYLKEDEGRFGKIIAQDALRIDPNIDAETLHKNIEHLQQYTYPKALAALDSKYRAENNYLNIYRSCPEIMQKLHDEVKSIMKSTSRPGFAHFSEKGIFDLRVSGYQNPYLVSGTDGVGTKLKIAQVCDKHNTIGIDLVAMCVNDILTHGAEPLFFLQSFDCASLNPQTALSVIKGISEGCKEANCALIDSELSELPEIYFNSKNCSQDFDNYDVVGYAEGALEKENILPRLNDINEDDLIIGIASSGVHSNGYSLVRKIVELNHCSFKDSFPLNESLTLGEALLTPTKIYVKSVLPLMKKKLIKAAAHITGGGLIENIPRVLPSSFKVVLDGSKWQIPPVLQWIAEQGRLSEKEMLKTFNCGIGMALIVERKHEKEILTHLKNFGENAVTIGSVKKLNEGNDQVEIKNFKLPSLMVVKKEMKKKRVGVLISGSGTNLQALIDYTQNPYNCSQAEIVLVISNVPEVEGLKRAKKAGIQTKVLSHKGFKKRVEFDMALNALLEEAKVEIVCLAGFMRILSKEFVEKWKGHLLNVHPAILPAFKGVNAHKQALEAGVKVTGCTVHFVEPEVDGGAIIEQAAVNINDNDTEKTLQEKVKVLEHIIFPKALELLASERISRDIDGKLIRKNLNK